MRLKFAIDGTTYSLPILREGFNLETRVGALGRHATSSSTFSLVSCDETNMILVHDGLLDAQIVEEDGTVIRTGVIRPYISAGYVGAHRENVELELIDYTEKLKEYVWPAPDSEADKKPGRVYPKQWKSQTLRTIVDWIMSNCGVTFVDSDVLSVSIPVITISEGQYLDEVLEELLFGYGLDYRFNANGAVEFFSTFAPETITEEITDIRGSVELSRNDDASDGVEISYSVRKHLEKARIFSDSHHCYGLGFIYYWEGVWYQGLMRNDGSAGNIADVSGATDVYRIPVTPTTGDKWLSSVKDNDGNIIPRDNIYEVFIDTGSNGKVKSGYCKTWMDHEKGITLTPYLKSYNIDGGVFYVAYKGWFQSLVNGWTFNAELKADITYREESSTTYKAEGPRPEKVYLKYVVLENDQDTYAQTFAEKYYKRQRNGKISVSFISVSPLEVGGFYLLRGEFPTVSGLNMGVRILSVTRGEDGLYSINAEGCSGIEVTQTVERHEVFDALPIPFQGIVSGGYDEEGNNDSDMAGAYISPDGEAKFNKIIIEGDGSLFESSVFKNMYSGEKIEIGTNYQEANVSTNFADDSGILSMLESLSPGERYPIESGTLEYPVNNGTTTMTEGMAVVREYRTSHVVLDGAEIPTEVSDMKFYAEGQTGSSYSGRFIFTKIVSPELYGKYITNWIRTTDLVISNIKEGIATKDIVPIDGERRYTISGFDIKLNNLYTMEDESLLTPVYRSNTVGVTNKAWHMLLPGGYAIQWGVASANANQGSIVVYLPIEMADTDYMVQLTVGALNNNGTDTDGYDYAPGINFKRTDVISITTAKSRQVNWLAIGKIKES